MISSCAAFFNLSGKMKTEDSILDVLGGRMSKASAYTKFQHPPKAHWFMTWENMEGSHFFVKYWGTGATNFPSGSY